MPDSLVQHPDLAVFGIAIHPSLAGTLGVSLLLVAMARFAIARVAKDSRVTVAAEAIVTLIERELAGIFDEDPRPFLPLLATLFLFLLVANLSAAVPGFLPPTEFIETAAALAVVVFAAVQIAGFRALGFGGYLRHFARPNALLLPFHILAEITRTLSLAVRLFGNMMSHGLVLAIIASIAGLLVPIPFLALGLLIGAVQAYIFTILAAVYIAAAISKPKGAAT
jgi:F-type H+-transporting ATPase subunit a